MKTIEERESCVFCEERGDLFGKGKAFFILQCAKCKLIWSNPLDVKTRGDANEKSYWAVEVYLRNARAQKRRFRKQLQTFLKQAKIVDPHSLSIIEVGSGLGFFLDLCEELGINVEGCDISKIATDYANRKKTRVRLGTLDKHYKDKSFDAVFAFNLIEHLPHPHKFLSEACRVLKPNGFLVIETPIQESLAQRLAKLGYFLTKGKINYLGINPGGHIHLFSEKTISVFCKILGFKIVYQRNISSPFREIWEKSYLVSFDLGLVYRISLPIVWAISRFLRQENRLFFILKKA